MLFFLILYFTVCAQKFGDSFRQFFSNSKDHKTISISRSKF